jgi:hypothetical protein
MSHYGSNLNDSRMIMASKSIYPFDENPALLFSSDIIIVNFSPFKNSIYFDFHAFIHDLKHGQEQKLVRQMV